MAKVTNIKLVGVGGQGILLATELLSTVLLRADHDVKTSEVHGMAQRGGSVFSDVRFGRKVFSPLIAEGKADILVGFEQIEAARYIDALSKNGVAIVNEQMIVPLAVSAGAVERPQGLMERIRQQIKRVEVLDALGLAKQAGNARTANTVILGALSRHLEITPDAWAEVLRDRLGAKLLRVNLQAFELGRNHMARSAA